MGGAGRSFMLAMLLALGSGCAARDPGAGGTRSEAPAAGASGPRTAAASPATRVSPAGVGAGTAAGAASGSDGFAIGFDDRLAPGIFQAELTARRDRPRGTQGLWATVSGLRRAERAEVVNLATGATTEVALFNGPVARGEARISNAAAVLLGIGAAPVRVRITVIRSEPVIVAP